MTRSDNPFGDLPEWKERQRLQEAQGQTAGQSDFYHNPQDLGQSYVPQSGYPQHAGQLDDGSLQHAPHPAPYYQEAAANASPLHYNVPPDGMAMAPSLHDPRHATPMSTYDPQTQITYPADVSRPLSANLAQAPMGYGVGHGQPDGGEGLELREGYYDDGGQYHVLAPNGQAGNAPAPGYDLNNFAPGQAEGLTDANAGYYEQAAPTNGQWNTGQMAAAAAQAPVGYDDDGDEYEEDYYDDDQDDAPRYSWKLLAAIVVTGAVVTGGGVVLYDSFMGGGFGKAGETPIVRANQRPAKTAPADAGGRKFANQDSKLLGRLDNSGGAKTKVNSNSAEIGNRVRSVPTVRIGADGRLILPKAPESVAAPTPSGNPEVVVAGQRVGPGINVVDSLGGSSIAGLGKLPQALPPADQPQVVNVAPQRPATPEVKPLNAAPAAPTVKNRGSANRATALKAGPPPVPSKSSLGSAWRMTGAEAAAQKKPTVGGIRPTIAQPVQPLQPRRQATAPVQTASTLGASGLVQSQRSKGYVAVLATAPTRMKALQSFAELQQRHPNALLNRVPDVQKADLSGRGLGIMYRVVVGPAGPRSTANSVCSSLKSEGYKGCWVKNN